MRESQKVFVERKRELKSQRGNERVRKMKRDEKKKKKQWVTVGEK